RARQQDAISRLSETALAESDLQKFLEQAVAIVSDILDVEFVKILEIGPSDAEMVLRAGVGWSRDLIGKVHVPTDRSSHAGYALGAGRPVILEDLATETRFSGSKWLPASSIVSGIATPIAARDGRAYGALCAHTAKQRMFSDYEAAFVAAVAN